MAQKTVIEAIREGMDEEMARDPSVFLIGEDVGQRGGVFLASDGLYKKYGELRVIDSPLAESCIVGVAGIGAEMACGMPGPSTARAAASTHSSALCSANLSTK